MSDPEPSIALQDQARAYADAQDAARGDWPEIRPHEDPDSGDALGKPPFPDYNSTMLEYLFNKAKLIQDAGGNGMVWLGVHAWMEGHIEGYDRAYDQMRRS